MNKSLIIAVLFTLFAHITFSQSESFTIYSVSGTVKVKSLKNTEWILAKSHNRVQSDDMVLFASGSEWKLKDNKGFLYSLPNATGQMNVGKYVEKARKNADRGFLKQFLKGTISTLKKSEKEISTRNQASQRGTTSIAEADRYDSLYAAIYAFWKGSNNAATPNLKLKKTVSDGSIWFEIVNNGKYAGYGNVIRVAKDGTMSVMYDFAQTSGVIPIPAKGTVDLKLFPFMEQGGEYTYILYFSNEPYILDSTRLLPLLGTTPKSGVTPADNVIFAKSH